MIRGSLSLNAVFHLLCREIQTTFRASIQWRGTLETNFCCSFCFSLTHQLFKFEIEAPVITHAVYCSYTVYLGIITPNPMLKISSSKDKFPTFPDFSFATKLNLIRAKFQFSFVSHFSPETVQCPVSQQIKRWKSKTFMAQNIPKKLGHCLQVRW